MIPDETQVVDENIEGKDCLSEGRIRLGLVSGVIIRDWGWSHDIRKIQELLGGFVDGETRKSICQTSSLS